MLSICKECKLNPYTIAESEDVFDKILNDQIDYTDMIGKAHGANAYESILCALLSERLLSNIEFQFLNNYPIEKGCNTKKYKNYLFDNIGFIFTACRINL